MNIRHIAKLAGVSPSAVSLALRDSPKISPKTRAMISKIAKESGYSPDARISGFMRHLRKPRAARREAAFGVVSFYDSLRPWERSLHLKRVFDGMKRRAGEIGYKLEPLWVRAPGMTYRRFRGILDARGVEGLLCFGSPDFELEFPRELDGCAIVTLGLSIRTPLHRVTSHFFNDTITALQRVHAAGYRRPGLVLGQHEETRSGHAHSAAYLGWCERVLGSGAALPVLRVDDVDRGPLVMWIEANEPDAIVFVHLPEKVRVLRTVLKEASIRVPADIGVAVLSHIVEGSGFSGLQQNQELMGAWAVELLAARIANHDLGIPANPRIEMVESQWIDGGSLRDAVGQTVGN